MEANQAKTIDGGEKEKLVKPMELNEEKPQKANLNALMEALQNLMKAIEKAFKWFFDAEYRAQLREERREARDAKREDKIKGLNVIKNELQELKQQVEQVNEQGCLTQEAVDDLTRVVLSFASSLDNLQSLDEKTIRETALNLGKELDKIQNKNERLLNAQYKGKPIMETLHKLTNSNQPLDAFVKDVGLSAKVFSNDDKLIVSYNNHYYEIEATASTEDDVPKLNAVLKEVDDIDVSTLTSVDIDRSHFERSLLSHMAQLEGYSLAPTYTPWEKFVINLSENRYDNSSQLVKIVKNQLIIENKDKNEQLVLVEKDNQISIKYQQGDKTPIKVGDVKLTDGKLQVMTSFPSTQIRESVNDLLSNKAISDYMATATMEMSPQVMTALFVVSDELVKSYKMDERLNVGSAKRGLTEEGQTKFNAVLEQCKGRFGQDGIQVVNDGQYLNVIKEENSFGMAFDKDGNVTVVNILDTDSNKYRPIYDNVTHSPTTSYIKYGEAAKSVLSEIGDVIGLDTDKSRLYSSDNTQNRLEQPKKVDKQETER